MTVVAAVNNPTVSSVNLCASPVFSANAWQLLTVAAASAASAAYNSGLQQNVLGVVAFVHQDVYLPKGWDIKLRHAITWLDEHDPNWAVLGIVGVDAAGETWGRTWSSGLQREVGRRIDEPKPVVSVDELVIVLRRDSGLRFDEQLPGFHLYGTDIALTAIERGLGAYVFDGPVIHNSLPVRALDKGYEAAYRYMQRKWKHRLPLRTLVIPVTKSLWPLRKQRLRVHKRRLSGWKPQTSRHPDPAQLARELGYETSD